MAGRGGYYGALHPVYRAFFDQNVSLTSDDATSFALSERRGLQSAAAPSSGSFTSTNIGPAT